MMGKSHVITNLANATGCWCIGNAVRRGRIQAPEPVVGACARIGEVLLPHGNGVLGAAVLAIRVLTFFIVGSLLPDIDHAGSILGRHVKFPGEHRGITHSIWPVLLVFGLAIRWNILLWLGFGYLLHLLWDSLSAGGICWLYPFMRYREYPGGAKVAPGHKLKLYKAGSAAEYVIVTVCVMTAFMLWVILVSGLV